MPLFGPPNVEKLKAKGDVRGLIKALDYEKDSSVRQAAAKALGEIGDPRGVGPLIAALKDRGENVRQAAAKALGEIGDTRAVEPLIAALKDKAVPVRMTAVGALGEIGDPRWVWPLIATLEDWSENVRQVPAGALVKIVAPAVEPLIAALKNGNAAAAGALERLGWQPDRSEAGAAYWVAKRQWDKCAEIGAPAVEPLIAALKDWDRDVRQAAAGVLVKIGAPAVEPLIVALKHGNAAAAGALGEIGDARAVEPLIATLKNGNAAAAGALDKLGWRPDRSETGAAYWVAKGRWNMCVEIGAPAVGPLIAALKDWGDRDVRQAAAGALVKIGAPAVEPFIVALKDGDKDVRQAAAAALDRFDWPSDRSKAEAAYRVAARQWGKCVEIGAPAVEPLIAALEDENHDARGAAAGALDKLGWQPDKSETGAAYWVAKYRWNMCVEIGAPAVEPLIAALKHGAAAAAGALGEIGDARAVEPLIATLRDANKHVREAAAGALDRLGWRPDRSETGAAYWVAKGRWNMCVEIGAPAVEPLIAALDDESRSVRRPAAEALVALYRSGKLDAQVKQKLLAMRSTIATPHRDYAQSNDCGHDDRGIGIEF